MPAQLSNTRLAQLSLTDCVVCCQQSLPSLDGDTPAQLLLLQKGIVQQQEKNERLLAELQQLLQRQQLPRSLKGEQKPLCDANQFIDAELLGVVYGVRII